MAGWLDKLAQDMAASAQNPLIAGARGGAGEPDLREAMAGLMGGNPLTQAPPPPPPKSPSKPRPRSTPARASAPKSMADPAVTRSIHEAAMRKRVEAAYSHGSGGQRDMSVRLSQIREHMSDLSRADQDVGFRQILQGVNPKAFLMRHDDPGQLSKADHAAAYSPAGEPFHVMWHSS